MQLGTRPIMRLRTLVVLTLTLGLLLFGAAPGLADKPFELEQNTTRTHHDFVNDLVAFWNITRDDYCSDPEDGIEAFVVSIHGAGEQGGFTSVTGSAYFELWEITNIQGEDSCEMTTGGGGPWATGGARVTLADRNPPSSTSNQPFAFAFRGTGDAIVEDGSGQLWDYKWVFEMLQQENGGFHITSQHFVLKPAS